jgi:hypothetical protein
MSPGCERNAGAQTPILAQRTVVRVGIRGFPVAHKDGSVQLDTSNAMGTCASGATR